MKNFPLEWTNSEVQLPVCVCVCFVSVSPSIIACHKKPAATCYQRGCWGSQSDFHLNYIPFLLVFIGLPVAGSGSRGYSRPSIQQTFAIARWVDSNIVAASIAGPGIPVSAVLSTEICVTVHPQKLVCTRISKMNQLHRKKIVLMHI